jgi:uncharacterized SAM-dependent methyltransferase
VWNEAEQRVEMHLVSERDQVVRVKGAGIQVPFVRDEWIWTESSYKYLEDQIVELGARAGFDVVEQWTHGDARFALTLFRAA